MKATKYGRIWIPTFNKELPQSVKAVHIADNSDVSKLTVAPLNVTCVKNGNAIPRTNADIINHSFFILWYLNINKNKT